MGDSCPALLAPAQNEEVTTAFHSDTQPPGSSSREKAETQLLRQADLLVLPAIVDQANT